MTEEVRDSTEAEDERAGGEGRARGRQRRG